MGFLDMFDTPTSSLTFFLHAFRSMHSNPHIQQITSSNQLLHHHTVAVGSGSITIRWSECQTTSSMTMTMTRVFIFELGQPRLSFLFPHCVYTPQHFDQCSMPPFKHVVAFCHPTFI